VQLALALQAVGHTHVQMKGVSRHPAIGCQNPLPRPIRFRLAPTALTHPSHTALHCTTARTHARTHAPRLFALALDGQHVGVVEGLHVQLRHGDGQPRAHAVEEAARQVQVEGDTERAPAAPGVKGLEMDDVEEEPVSQSKVKLKRSTAAASGSQSASQPISPDSNQPVSVDTTTKASKPVSQLTSPSLSQSNY
jgi:hypothetical protein